jgi:hypothetical protein
MAQNPLKSVNNYLSNNFYSYIETSGGQSSNLYLNVLNQGYLDICGSLRLLFFALVSDTCCSIAKTFTILNGRLLSLKP